MTEPSSTTAATRQMRGIDPVGDAAVAVYRVSHGEEFVRQPKHSVPNYITGKLSSSRDQFF